MNARGIAAMVLGWWVISQVLLGDALDRIGIFSHGQYKAPAPAGSKSGGSATSPPGASGGRRRRLVPDIPLVPQGPVTGIPFSPVSSRRRYGLDGR